MLLPLGGLRAECEGTGMAVGKLGILGVDTLLTVDRASLVSVVLSLGTGLRSKCD